MNARGKPSSSLLLMAGGEHGGRGKGDPVLSAFIAKRFKKAPSVLYVGAASDDDPSYFSVIEPVLTDSGAAKVFMARFEDGLAPQPDLVFISGGDVESGMANLEASGGIEILAALFKAGTPFVGVSAGSIMLGKAWIRWSDPDDDSTASLFPCLGFAGFVFDAHDEFDGWGELKSALSLCPAGEAGYGIPTGGAVLVEPGREPEALGKNPVFFIADGKGGNKRGSFKGSLESRRPFDV